MLHEAKRKDKIRMRYTRTPEATRALLKQKVNGGRGTTPLKHAMQYKKPRKKRGFPLIPFDVKKHIISFHFIPSHSFPSLSLTPIRCP
jgi:hypothetical protein